MPNADNHGYDVIIIGAGISGLVCGCYLAKAGMKVLIAEQHNKPGGYCTSFKRNGFTFDAAAHSFGSYRQNGNMSKIITDLDLDVKIIKYDPSDIIISPDLKFSLCANITNTIYNLRDLFPRERRGIRDFFDFLLGSKPIDFVTLRKKTFKEFLTQYFSDEKLIAMLSFPILGNGGLPPSLISAFTGAKIYTEFLLDGGYYPKGGMQTLSNALADKFRLYGGELLLSVNAKKIAVKNKTVNGVMLEKVGLLPSRYVVSSCDARQTFYKLLGKKLIGEALVTKLNRMVPSLSVFVSYLGIDQPFSHLPKPGVNVWLMPHYNVEAMYSSLKKIDIDHPSVGYMVRVSPEGNSLQAFVNAPYRTWQYWEKNKYRLLDGLIKKIEQHIPNLSNHMIYKEAATPHTMQRYTLNYRGAAYGWASMPSQLFTPELKTRMIKGLHLCGHWTSQTQGVPGVAYLGYETARLILKKETFI